MMENVIVMILLNYDYEYMIWVIIYVKEYFIYYYINF